MSLSLPVGDLDLLISHARAALTFYADDDPAHSSLVFDLGYLLRDQYERLGSSEDLYDSIGMFRSSLSLVRREGRPSRFSLLGSQAHPSELMICHELATSLMIRFEGQATVIDLEEAVGLFRRVLENYHGITPHYFVVLSNFTSSLHASFLHSGRIQELNEAIKLFRCSISVSYSDDWRHRPGILSSFANALISRFHHYGRSVDLHEAIILYHTTVNLLPEGDSRRARLLEDLARAESALDGLGQDEIPNNANPA